jgi:2-haloacid dehalogenase
MTLSLSATWMAIALGLSLLGLGGHAHAQPAPRFKAVAFDYFVIFDANSIVPEVEMAFPGKSAEFTRIWRAKQFEYCYLRTITGRFADFSLVTEDALVYAAEAMHLELAADTRQRLLNAYLNLKRGPTQPTACASSGLPACASSRFPSSAAPCSAPMPSTQA